MATLQWFVVRVSCVRFVYRSFVSCIVRSFVCIFRIVSSFHFVRSCIVRSFRVSCFHFVYRAFFVSFVWSVRSFFVRFVCVFRSFAVGAYCKLIRSSIYTSLTFQIYTPCRTNVSGIYNLQDKIFRFMYPVRSFADSLPCRTNRFRFINPLQDKRFRFIHPARQTFRFIHPARQTFHIYTPGKTYFSDLYTLQNKSDLCTLQDKLFRITHPARQSFQICTPCKSNFSDIYSLQA
jgi:hypothetical protein